jgi:hypothetical protein
MGRPRQTSGGEAVVAPAAPSHVSVLHGVMRLSALARTAECALSVSRRLSAASHVSAPLRPAAVTRTQLDHGDGRDAGALCVRHCTHSLCVCAWYCLSLHLRTVESSRRSR